MKPKHIPPLEPQFLPAVLANHTYLKDIKESCEAIPLVISLERGNDSISRYETLVSTSDIVWVNRSKQHLERLIKFLLWSHGAKRIYIGGSKALGELIQQAYMPDGSRCFDYDCMTRIYGSAFEVNNCGLDEAPFEHEANQSIGGNLDGYRVGFDLGATDLKVSAVANGEAIFSAEIEWNPSDNLDPEYHRTYIREAIILAASKLPRLDAIGGSSAGVYVNNQPRIASIFRRVPEDQYARVNQMFDHLAEEFGVPLYVINDGEVTALAGAMSLGVNGVVGIALGSSEAGGYVNRQGNISDHLDELAFAPIDYNPNAARDEWSQDRGVGVSYLSQTAVFRLSQNAGLNIPQGVSVGEQLKYFQELLESGDKGARQIWESMGIYLGYALAHYADFYDFDHVMLLGRCTSGVGGSILMHKAQIVLQDEFPGLMEKVNLQLPDERNRRVGQAIAAASLPELLR
ncbi:MAG: ROK family protein [Anaerolineaceae bacterium]|nr:ROK family protein [Anaerolineaceae bacterium]